ncbi:MAG: hypothetical protein ACREUB_05565 [Burkholderiales bacterium]
MRGLFAVAALAGLSGCAGFAPLDEAERARIRVVAPAAARFSPEIDFKLPPGKAEGAAAGGAGMAMQSGQLCSFAIFFGPANFFACLAAFGGTGAVIGAAGTPSNEGLETMVERGRSQLGAQDVQQLLMQRFSERVTRLTLHEIVPSARELGPQSRTDAPNYAGLAAGENVLVAEVSVLIVGATLGEGLFGKDYAARPLRIGLTARMRVVRPSDGTAVMTRHYFVSRYGRSLQEYQEDGARLLQTIAGAVDEVATLMVDDAFLLRSDAAGADGTPAPAVEALDPLPSGRCFITLADDCWLFKRVPRLDTVAPTFRWKPFPEASHFETAPWLRTARDLVYDLWIFGGDDDRVVEGLRTTEHKLARPLPECMRYFWAVRARFDTDAGPRTVEWSTASGFFRMQLQTLPEQPTYGAPFITPCPAKAAGPPSGSEKP